MKPLFRVLIILTFMFGTNMAVAKTYGAKICKKSGYTCQKIKKGDTWEKLFSSKSKRDVVKRLNRMNVQLRRGQVIAVPNSFWGLDKMDIAPFPSRIKKNGKPTVIVDQSDLAWGAYNASGVLVNWGPISGGKSYCADVNRSCRTVKGNFTVQRKQGAGCKSSKYPLGKGGAPMPYCMHFYRGFAMHGSPTVPGYNASHGCVRLFVEDAQWLNKKFVKPGKTKVIVRQ